MDRISVWDPAQLKELRDAEDGRRQAEGANKHIVMAMTAVAREEGRRQAEQALAQPQSAAPPTDSRINALRGVGAQKLAKDPKGPAQTTQAAVLAIAHYMYDQALPMTADPYLLAQQVINNAVKNELPDAELLTPRSVSVLVRAAQEGTRRARKTR